jgi:N-acetylglucosamine-6-sulfatase
MFRALAVCLYLTSSLAASAAGPPNVVVVMTDDQRWDQMSCAGHPFLHTPQLDRLAAEGVMFTNAFTTTSLCSPSRASFLSGVYAHTHGVLDNFTDFPQDLPSYPKRLKAEGYATAYIGKWHMGEDDDSPRPGFDHWASHTGQGNYFDNTFNIDGTRKELKGYYTHVVTDLAIDFIEKGRPKDKPFCLIVGHKAAHTPYTPEPKYARLFDDVAIDYPHSALTLDGKPKWIVDRLDTWHGIYGPVYGYRKEFPDRTAAGVLAFQSFVRSVNATIPSVDDSVGRIYQSLQNAGILDDTLFVFASDNGALLGEHGMTDKRTMHEPSIRIPLLMRYPQRIRAGSKIDKLVLNVDFAPTVLELCGATPIEKTHGRSIVPLFDGNTDGWRSSFLYEYNYEKQFPYTPNVRGVRTEGWKFIRYPHGDGSADRHLAELYDLVSDPEERHNLIDDERFDAQEDALRKELDRLQRETGALPDKMPLDEGIKSVLPDAKIR